jgi:alkylation response protein AidB-like acyl-CoA dehydrogenase
MDLNYSNEQRLLADSAKRFLAAHAAPGAGPATADRTLWGEFAGLGWLGLPLPESHDGLGQGAVDVAILTEAIGRTLTCEPYVPTVVLCAGLVAAAGTPDQKAAVLPGIVAGKTQMSLAHVEQGARDTVSHVATVATVTGDGWTLNGEKTAVLGGGTADLLLVSARVSGSSRDPHGIALFIAPRAAVEIKPYETVDGHGAAIVTLADTALPANARLGDSDDALPALEAAIDQAIAAWCSELVGIMDVLLAATVDYTKTRTQFGQPLAMNQVLRHRMADMSMACEEARSLALRAALLVGDPDPSVRGRAVSGAKAKVAGLARFVAEQAVQMHGGMGVTDELTIGAYLKRVVALAPLFGSPEHHLRRHAALSGYGRAMAS